jgi:hypothetical protein
VTIAAIAFVSGLIGLALLAPRRGLVAQPAGSTAPAALSEGV